MIRKGLRPAFRIGMVPRDGRDGYRRVWPFRRSWLAIAILMVMDIIFLIPAVSTFRQAISEWSKFDSLFDLVGALFISAWLLGWATAPLIAMRNWPRSTLVAGLRRNSPMSGCPH